MTDTSRGFITSLHCPKELPKFLLFGAISAGVTLATGLALYGWPALGLPYWCATGIGATVGMLMNFYLNYSFNFRFRGRSALQQLRSFFLVSGLGVLLTSVLSEFNLCLIGFLSGNAVQIAAVSMKATVVANVLAVGMVAAYSFPAHKFVSFNVGLRRRLAQIIADIATPIAAENPVDHAAFSNVVAWPLRKAGARSGLSRAARLPSASTPSSGRLIVVMSWTAVCLLPFLAYAASTLHAFYLRGSALYDAGHYAYMLHDGGFDMQNPPAVGGSFLRIHISPLFLLTTVLGHLLPLSRSQFYAAFVGVSHALPGIAVFWLLVAGYRMNAPYQRLLAALLALLFAFSGLALAIARYPNLPMFFVGCASMFLTALVLRRLGLALLFFALCLATREDAGLHLFALLSLVLILRWWQGARRSELKQVAGFATAALFYSGAVIVAQLSVLHEHSLLVTEYIGQPPFSHVTARSIGTWFLGWMVYRDYVVLPALVAVGWAIAHRNPQVVLGYAAFLPWGLLHLAAATPRLAALPSYYAFPFVLAGFWPLVGLHMAQRSGVARSPAEAIYGFMLLTLASLVPSPELHNPMHINLPADFFSPPSIARQGIMDRALTRLAGTTELGTQVVDESVAALVPDLYRPSNVLPTRTAPDTVIYFADGFQSRLAREVAESAGLNRIYAVRGTAIRVAGRQLRSAAAGLVELRPSE